MQSDWERCAQAWIASVGERGDWSREHVVDPVMLSRIAGRGFVNALDVGCGEGRFCRIMRAAGILPVGLDPTPPLLEEARRRDPLGDYRLGHAEKLEFEAESFDLVVSYLTLIDIGDFRRAIGEMGRVLRPGGTLLIANLTSFTSACAAQGWIRDDKGRPLHYPLDRYLEEFPYTAEWSGMRVTNWHRPLGAYIAAFLELGLQLAFFAEPEPASAEKSDQETYRRAPWFVVMEWRRPGETRPA
jgi:SAM-dependent methyltransferase